MSVIDRAAVEALGWEEGAEEERVDGQEDGAVGSSSLQNASPGGCARAAGEAEGQSGGVRPQRSRKRRVDRRKARPAPLNAAEGPQKTRALG